MSSLILSLANTSQPARAHLKLSLPASVRSERVVTLVMEIFTARSLGHELQSAVTLLSLTSVPCSEMHSSSGQPFARADTPAIETIVALNESE